MDAIRVGVIGCGNISQQYFDGASQYAALDIIACADLNDDAARQKAEENGISALSVNDLLKNDELDLIINLTIPRVHADVSKQILSADKHVHSEKPLGTDLDEARGILSLAAEKGLRVGCAPDTFLGAGQQTSRKMLDDGWIGEPLTGTAMMMSPGPEAWHPNPSIFFDIGAGPMLDMGPYYITALINLLGPVKSVTARTSRARGTRFAAQLGNQPFPVNVDTHYSGILEFVSGPLITLIMSFDVKRHRHRPIELYGSLGSLLVPDPNTFDNPVRIFIPGNDDFQPSAFTHNVGYKRSVGAADMIQAITSNRAHRCNGELALHALEVMLAFEASSTSGQVHIIESSCERPAALPMGLMPGVLD